MLLSLAFLFFIGSMLGWWLEVFYRRLVSQKKWVNPGFLVGPYLPLYGTSLCMLYLLAELEQILPIDNLWLRKIILFLVMAIAITIVEYIAGIIFIKGMKCKLWDYSMMWGNIQGVICPLYSFFWYILSAIYYFLIHPHILKAVYWLSNNLAFSFFIGAFFGVFVLDFVYSTKLMVKIRRFALESGIIILLEELREEAKEKLEEQKHRTIPKFFFSFRTEAPFHEHLERYREKYEELAGSVNLKRKK